MAAPPIRSPWSGCQPLIGASLLGRAGSPLGRLVDAAVELRSGRILHYLVARSDPRLPGSSRWRLSPERIVDQQPGQVFTALEGLDDLPLARASVRQEFLRRSRRWRDQMQEESLRLRDQVQQVGGRFEERLEGWLEEQPWDADEQPVRPADPDAEAWDDWPDSDSNPGAWTDRPDDRPSPRRRPAPVPREDSEQDPWF